MPTLPGLLPRMVTRLMPFIRLDPTELNPKALLKDTAPSEARAVRHAAMEFEALLLKQLTAALNPTEEEGDGLFGSNEGSFYKQMFSEQLATAMARQGGVGLADVIVQRLSGKAAAVAPRGAQRALEMARLVREDSPAATPGEQRTATQQQGAAQPVTLGVSIPVPRELPALSGSAAAAPVAPAALSAPTAASLARNAPMAAAPAAVALHLPLKGRVSSGFGVRHDPLHGRIRRHTGVDIAAAQGTPIAAAAAGKVVFAGRRGGYGNLVEIEHADGQRTRYAHTARMLVKVGDEVKPGQAIATVGSTGRSTGPHLHFEVKKDGARIDPLQAVAKDSKRSRR